MNDENEYFKYTDEHLKYYTYCISYSINTTFVNTFFLLVYIEKNKDNNI